MGTIKNEITYSFNEICPAHFDNRLNNSAVDICQPNTQQRADNKKNRKKHEVACFDGCPARNDLFDQLNYSLPEKSVDVAFSSALNEI